MTPDISLALAALAGLASFLSPCVLPLVPAYLSFITGASFEELTAINREGEDRRAHSPEVLRHGILFVLGFSLVFILTGGVAGFLGNFLTFYSKTFQLVGGGFLVLFGILLLGILPVAWMNREWRMHLRSRPAGNVGTVAAGMVFGFGWTPCIGPILGGILTLAAAGEAPLRGMALLTAYSAGLAIPFLLAAVGISRFLGFQRRIGPWLLPIQRVSGVILILLGILLMTGEFTRMAAALNSMTPDFLREWM
jgi:cytochrome c-type biogenesis protein